MELPENTIICGDCLEVMKDWPDNCVDLVFTSPPYNAKDIGKYHKSYDVAPMQIDITEYIKWCKEWYKQADRISKKIVYIPGISNINYYPSPYWIVCWHKPASVSFNRLGGYNAWEPICLSSGPAKGKRLGQDYILRHVENFRKGPERLHPCPFPLSLAVWVVDKFSNTDDVVLDLMCGSGTTCVAAKMLGRKFIGIDISSEYCEIARQRLEAVDTGVPVKEQNKGQQALFKD